MHGQDISINTGTKMPSIGFGTWQLIPEDAYRSVRDALKIGYRLVDTARIYRNEEAVGEAIKDSGFPRKDIFLTTKLWNSDQGYDSGLRAFDDSLKRLGQEYVDLYLIHWPGEGSQKRADSWKVLVEIYKQGRSKAIGVSNYTVHHLKELLKSSEHKPAVNQVEFHPFIYEEQKELLAFCKKHTIVFEAYSPLARGRLNEPLLAEIGQKYGKSASQVMIRWAIQHGTVPLPRSSNPDHIADNFNVFDFKLSDNDMAVINSINQASRTAWDPTELP
jgi:methylglyoxal/glyoxal reductase